MDWFWISRRIVVKHRNCFRSARDFALSSKHDVWRFANLVVGQLHRRPCRLQRGSCIYDFEDSQRFIREIMNKNQDDSNEDRSRDELIANLEQFQDDLKDSVSNKSTQLKALIGGASSLAMFSSFLLGRKSGKKRGSRSDSETAE